jgi:hypothetical protein
MIRLAINAVAIPIYDARGRLTRNASAKGLRKIMSNLSLAERSVAARCGVSPEAFARTKKKPINGRPLHGIDGGYGDNDNDNSGQPYPAGPADGPPGSGPYPGKRASSPFPDAPTDYDSSPGLNDDDDDADPMGLRLNKPAKVIFPAGSRKKKSQSK